MPLWPPPCGFGLARNHLYRDGNKRVAFLATYTFLGLNGLELTATEAELVTQFVALAAGQVTEDQLAEWIRDHVTRAK